MTYDADLGLVAERLTRRFGPGVADWCAGIPAMVRTFAGRWALSPDDLFPSGNSSVVIRCTRSGGSAAVLKLSPDLPVVAEQAETLRLFGASGRVPAILAADLTAGAVRSQLRVRQAPLPTSGLSAQMGYLVGSVVYWPPDGVVHRSAPSGSWPAFHLGAV